jgi:hypothetical protein
LPIVGQVVDGRLRNYGSTRFQPIKDEVKAAC